MPSRNISLTEHFDAFLERNIRTGRFAIASEVVRAGLYLLELREREEEARRAALQAAAAEGFGALDRGEDVLLDGDAALRRKLCEVGRGSESRRASVTKG
jgi:antitoxin ParD1/3/4